MSLPTMTHLPRTITRPEGRYEASLHASPAAIAPLWLTLERDGGVAAFQSLDWTRNVLAHLAEPEGARALIVEIRERVSGRPVMIVPLALHRRRGCKVVTWLDFGVCDFAAPLLAPGPALDRSDMTEIWSEVLAVLPKADLVHVERIPTDLPGPRNPFMLLPGVRPMTMQASGVVIEGEPETLLERICRPSVAKTILKNHRRIERTGETRLVEARTPEDVDRMFDAIVEQRRQRFEELGRFDLLRRPEIRAFYRDAALSGLTGGPARILGLSVGGEWLALAYGLVHAERFNGILLTSTGDRAWRSVSPGIQILAHTLTWARRQGVTYYDFSVGDMAYKANFGVEPRDLHSLVQPLSLKGHLLAQSLEIATAGRRWLDGRPALHARLQGAVRGVRRLRARRAAA